MELNEYLGHIKAIYLRERFEMISNQFDVERMGALNSPGVTVGDGDAEDRPRFFRLLHLVGLLSHSGIIVSP